MKVDSNLACRILAHRGLSKTVGQGGDLSHHDISRALKRGFGVEVDLRDMNGILVISHDPPREDEKPMPFQDFLESLENQRLNEKQIVAINIKSSGLSQLMPEIEAEHFFFDLATPDMISFTKRGLNVAARVSEYEPLGAYSAEMDYFWVDGFEDDSFFSEGGLRPLLNLDALKVLVSPELHGRSPFEAWAQISDLFLERTDLAICTDLPEEFARFVIAH